MHYCKSFSLLHELIRHLNVQIADSQRLCAMKGNIISLNSTDLDRINQPGAANCRHAFIPPLCASLTTVQSLPLSNIHVKNVHLKGFAGLQLHRIRAFRIFLSFDDSLKT